MSHKHASLMRSIFQDPPSANIHWREIEAFLHHPHNSSTCSRTDIKQLREVLTHAGVTLSSYEAGQG